MTGIGKLGQSLPGDCLTGIASDLMAGYQGPAVCWLCSPHPCGMCATWTRVGFSPGDRAAIARYG